MNRVEQSLVQLDTLVLTLLGLVIVESSDILVDVNPMVELGHSNVLSAGSDGSFNKERWTCSSAR